MGGVYTVTTRAIKAWSIKESWDRLSVPSVTFCGHVLHTYIAISDFLPSSLHFAHNGLLHDVIALQSQLKIRVQRLRVGTVYTYLQVINSVAILRTSLIAYHLLIILELLLASAVLTDRCQAISANTASSKRSADAEDTAQPLLVCTFSLKDLRLSCSCGVVALWGQFLSATARVLVVQSAAAGYKQYNTWQDKTLVR